MRKKARKCVLKVEVCLCYSGDSFLTFYSTFFSALPPSVYVTPKYLYVFCFDSGSLSMCPLAPLT